MQTLVEIKVDVLEPSLTEVIVASYEGEYDEETGEYSGQALAKFDNECTYEGVFQKGLFHGKGKYTWSDSVTFEGDFKLNSMSGKGTYTYADGSVYFGDIVEGKRHGLGKLTTSAGQTYEGEWRTGQRHGQGKMIYNSDQTIVYTGEWAENKRQGYGVMQYPSGNSYEGEWRGDHKNGYGTMIWKDLDEVYTGHWSRDLPHGFGEHIWGESTVKTVKRQYCNMYRGEFVSGNREGKGCFFYANGSQHCGQWHSNKKNGVGVFLFTDNRISVGIYEDNKLVSGIDTQNLLATRDSGDISSQFFLNIVDILTTYPSLPTSTTSTNKFDEETLMNQRKQYIKELERLLLKYNQYIKNTYKHYMEEANRIRQRTLLPLPAREQYSSPSKHQIAVAAVKARRIHKRAFCMSMDTMVQCLREMGVIDMYFTAEDATNIVKKMRKNRLNVITQLYRILIQNNTPPSPPDEAESSIRMDTRTLKRLVAEANLSYCDVMDAYLDPHGHDPDFSIQGSQPILEHEFVEILVRSVAEAYARRGHINVDLFQILSKIFHQRMLPLLTEGTNILTPFQQHFYVDQVQDALKNRRIVVAAPPPPLLASKTPKLHHMGSTLHGSAAALTAPAQEEFLSADKVQRNKVEDLWWTLRHSVTNPRDVRASQLTQGGAVRAIVIVDFLVAQGGTWVSAGITAEALFRVVFGEVVLHPSDLPWSRMMSYEDFVELLSRVIHSDLWIHGTAPEVSTTSESAALSTNDDSAVGVEESKNSGTMKLQALQILAQDDSQSSVTTTALLERLTRFLK